MSLHNIYKTICDGLGIQAIGGDYVQALANYYGVVDDPNKELESEVFAAAVANTNEWTEEIVDITASQILNMGSVPIVLLPASGANKYYDIDKVIIEYTHKSTPYSLAESYLTINFEGATFGYIAKSFNKPNNSVVIVSKNSADIDTVNGISVVPNIPLNRELWFNTFEGYDPTDGDGTFRVKIYYKTLTFGE